jgi:hypothetical protein
MTQLLSFRQYAAKAGLNPSSVSRAVAKGRIPIVEIDGTRFINPVAADAALAERRSAAGGSPETRAAHLARWRAKAGCGFDLGQLRLLGVLTAHGPRLLVDGMRAAGAHDEIEIARAAATMHQLVEYLACSAHDSFNRQGVSDYRHVLPEPIKPDFTTDAAREAYARLTRPDDFDDIEPDADIWPTAWSDELFAAFGSAQL